LRVVATFRTAIEPEVLFDLSADPQGRVKWHEHPKGCDIDTVDSAPGAAMQGARFSTTGRLRGIPFDSTTLVTLAERPRLYATQTEMTMHHPQAVLLKQLATERYTIQRVVDWLLATSATRRNIRLLIRSAERHVGVTA